ncbi:MAG: CCA tRNA nucleotidyltransferase [Candidatus Aenigmarchaeota archaeon]|nr:CCA tRNA nucleotidyltransferase [Candidatus Aenigmarchaeota archaeon]
MDKTDSLLQSVLRKITPTGKEQEQMGYIKGRVVSAAEKVLQPEGLGYTLAGSLLRDTWMRDKKEFDLFIMFPEETTREDLERKGLEIGKEIARRVGGSHVIAYAEHPYVRAKVDGYDVDIVPCYKLEKATDIKSAVDRTPFHNQWILQNLKKEASGEVRLLKQFLKCNKLYGSDMKVLGFSGYLCEILIVKYGSFRNLASKASGWNPGEYIDLKGYHKEKPAAFRNHPLVVIDPVDHNRNVAAVMSHENFMRFAMLCRGFAKKPSVGFFFREKGKVNPVILRKIMNNRKTRFLLLTFQRPGVLEDILWPQMRRAAQRISNILEEYEFRVLGWGVWSGDRLSCMLLEMETWELPAIRKLVGPRIFAGKHVKEFTAKYKSGRLYIENDYWVAEVPRPFRTAEGKLRDSLTGPQAELRAKGIPSYIAESVSKKFSILRDGKMAGIKEGGFLAFLGDYLEKEVRPL